MKTDSLTLVYKSYFYLAQSIGDMATSVRNGDMVGNDNINFVKVGANE